MGIEFTVFVLLLYNFVEETKKPILTRVVIQLLAFRVCIRDGFHVFTSSQTKYIG